VGFCVVLLQPAEAKTVRVASFNIEGTNSMTGPGPVGSADYVATKAVLARINADIVAFQELLGGTNETNWRSIANELGYQHVLFGTNGTSMSGNQRLGYFSRFPITNSATVSSPTGANEMTRLPLRVVINVAGAAKPLVLWNMHHKADDGTSTNTPGNQFRRAVEAYRIVQDINAYRASNPSHDEFVMMGDLNDDFSNTAQAAQFTNIPSVTSPSFDLGSDIQFPVLYRVFPDQRYASAGGGLHRLDLRQQNGSSRVTRPASGRTLDYILVSSALRDSPLGAPRGEVYNSQLEMTHPGLPKAGQALASSTSLAASDHLAVFADIEMANAEPAPSITSFSPAAGAPGALVTIDGLMLGGTTSVRFGGVDASFSVVSDTRITATVPDGALSAPISVSGPAGNAESSGYFAVASLPTVVSAAHWPSALTDFTAAQGAVSAAQSLSVSAAGLAGPLQISAPAGFQLSLDGTNFTAAVQIVAPSRLDASSNYAGSWTNGSTAGSGFGAWQILANSGTGQAEAFIGDPTVSLVEGMGTTAFGLRANPEASGANVWAWRALQRPLAVGEALSFDWGINWDSNNGSKGFVITSGSASLLYVSQNGYPGPIFLWHGNNFADTGLPYGTRPMRWTFRQIDATTLSITATGRSGGTNVAYATNIPVVGAVDSFWWFADQMEPDPKRVSYYDNLQISPIAAGGGALSPSLVYVRLASNAPVGSVSGTVGISSGGQSLASVGVSGTVTGATNAYNAWAQSHGLDPQGNGARAADPDADGHSNLREFLLGGLPAQATGALWRADRQSSGLLLTFVVRETGALYELMSSGNLNAGTWSEETSVIGDSPDQDGVPPGYKRRQVLAPNPPGNRFFRLETSESSP